MSAFDGCTQADYEAAAFTLCTAIEADSKTRKALGSASWNALLDVRDFHDRCLILARAFATERENQAAIAAAQPVPGDGSVSSTEEPQQ